MAEQLDLNSDDQNKLSELAISALQEGKIIIAPLEHAYVFVADAFNHGALKKIHSIRGDDRGVAAQNASPPSRAPSASALTRPWYR